MLSVVLSALETLMLSCWGYPNHREYMSLASIAASDCLFPNISAFMSIRSIYLGRDGCSSGFEFCVGHGEECARVSHNCELNSNMNMAFVFWHFYTHLFTCLKVYHISEKFKEKINDFWSYPEWVGTTSSDSRLTCRQLLSSGSLGCRFPSELPPIHV